MAVWSHWRPAAVRSCWCQEGTGTAQRELRQQQSGTQQQLTQGPELGKETQRGAACTVPAPEHPQGAAAAPQSLNTAFPNCCKKPACYLLDNPRNTKCNFALHAKGRHPAGLLGYCFLTQPQVTLSFSQGQSTPKPRGATALVSSV